MQLDDMRRVLVTGAAGFVGRAALLSLNGAQWEVHACGRGERPPSIPPHVDWHVADLAECAAREGLLRTVRPTDLLHLAWYTKHAEYWRSAENFSWVEASLHLIRRFRELGGGRVVCAGTCAEYEWGAGLCSEARTPLRPATPYGICKDALRQIVQGYADVSGLSWAWGRLFLLHGPYEQPERLVPSVIRALLRGQRARCTSGDQERDFLHVSDASAALVSLLASDVQAPVNIASGQAVTLRAVVNLIGELIGRSELLEFETPPLTRDEPRALFADTSRLTEEVGWRPRLSLRDGLAETIRFHRSSTPG